MIHFILRSADNPSYTIDLYADDPGDERSDGRDERIRYDSDYQALDVWYHVLRSLG